MYTKKKYSAISTNMVRRHKLDRSNRMITANMCCGTLLCGQGDDGYDDDFTPDSPPPKPTSPGGKPAPSPKDSEAAAMSTASGTGAPLTTGAEAGAGAGSSDRATAPTGADASPRAPKASGGKGRESHATDSKSEPHPVTPKTTGRSLDASYALSLPPRRLDWSLYSCRIEVTGFSSSNRLVR